jgi:hypothetical protein
MNHNNVARVLRADGVFNLLAGFVLLFFYRPVVALIGWPDTDVPIYANVLGAALIGLSLAVLFAANHPDRSRDAILASIVAKALAGVVIVYQVFLVGIELPSPWLLPAAVVVQVLFVLGEAAYLVSRGLDVTGPARRLS